MHSHTTISSILFVFFVPFLNDILEKANANSVDNNPNPLSVVTCTASSVTLMWRMRHPEEKEFVKDLHHLQLQYRPISFDHHFSSRFRSRIEENYTYYEAVVEDREFGTSGDEWNVRNLTASDLTTILEQNRMLITVSNLLFYNTRYEFVLTRRVEPKSPNNGVIESARVVQRTKFGVPANPPKFSSGCFEILDVNVHNRTVRIYWQKKIALEQYEVHIYEDGLSAPIASFHGELADESLTRTISLKRHYFSFRRVNVAGSSKSFSVVNIPPHTEILPPPLSISVFDKLENITVLMWQKPKNFVVNNYTLFWVDGVNGPESFGSVLATKSLNGNRTSVEIRSREGSLPLALSVNTEHSSSGMHLVRTCH